MSRLRDLLTAEGLRVASAPKGKITLLGHPYRRDRRGGKWEDITVKDADKIMSLASQGYDVFVDPSDGGSPIDLDGIGDEIKNLEARLKYLQTKHKNAKKVADELKKFGISPEDLHGGYDFSAIDEDGVSWSEERGVWYRDDE
jgi:hypothetical protein